MTSQLSRTPFPRRRVRPALLTLLIGATLILASSAAAATTSANWAGYAVHGGKTNYKRITGAWTVSKPTCTTGTHAFSAAWVGIGGYGLHSRALEQTGTETDCKRNGTSSSSAWFEVVPAPSHRARLTVKAGDRIKATVTVNGHTVTLNLRDLTSGKGFTKRIVAATVDTSSAEWIVEAPSRCSSATVCTTLPLADFGRIAFADATVTTRHGHTGTITSRLWKTTKIMLKAYDHARLAADGQVSQATPTAVTERGTAFSVAFSQATATLPLPGTGFGPGSGGAPPGFPVTPAG